MTKIAEELGVSRSLVSYAIKGKYGVSEEMKRKIVLKAIEMGYFKTAHASLKFSKNIAIVIDEIHLSSDSFFHRIVKGVEYATIEKKFVPRIINYESDEGVERFVSKIIDLNPRGIIVIRQFEREFLKRFEKLNYPLVFIDLVSPNSEYFEVRANNFSNMNSLTTYLIDKGFNDLTFVGDVNWATSFKERFNGFETACSERGVKHTDIISSSASKDFAFDKNAFLDYVNNNENGAFVCANDSIAVEVFDILKQLGKRIPQDFSVVGFDDIDKAISLSPPLTTMHIPKFEMGRVAFGLLYDQFGGNQEKGRVVCLNAKLVERASVLTNNKV